jgi:glutamate-1-semialdehyde aminotransferase
MALYIHGVDATDRYILSAKHTEQDIDETVEVLERALAELREERVI